jgi:hypothetical protein
MGNSPTYIPRAVTRVLRSVQANCDFPEREGAIYDVVII